MHLANVENDVKKVFTALQQLSQQVEFLSTKLNSASTSSQVEVVVPRRSTNEDKGIANADVMPDLVDDPTSRPCDSYRYAKR